MQGLEGGQLAAHPMVVQVGLRRVHWRQAVRTLVHSGGEIRILDVYHNFGISGCCFHYLALAGFERGVLAILQSS